MDATLKSLYFHQRVAALETQTLSITDFVKRTIPNLITDIRGFFTTLKISEDSPQLTSREKDFIKEVSAQNYMDLVPLVVYVPEGLDVTYVSYLMVLEDAVNCAQKVEDELQEYVAFISRLLNNADELRSTHYVKSKYESITNEIDAINEKVAGCFKKGSIVTDVKYGHVVQNNREWEHVFAKATEVNMILLRVSKKNIQAKIATASELLELLYKKTNRGELDTITPEMVSKIADYTYAIARYLEFFSVVCYRARAVTESINASVDKVMKVLKP